MGNIVGNCNDIIKRLWERFSSYVLCHIYISALALLIIVILIPIFLFCYMDDQSLTIDGLFSFYGTMLTFVATICLSALALYQNIRANDINKRLLMIEHEKNAPFIDIGIVDNTNFLGEDNYLNYYCLTIQINDHFCDFTDKNKLGDGCDLALIFKIKNTKSNDIIHIKPLDITYCTVFENKENKNYREEFQTDVKTFLYNTGGRILPANGEILVAFSGIYNKYPAKNDTMEKAMEAAKLGYYNPAIELTIKWLLTNHLGGSYELAHQIKFSILPLNDNIHYPYIIEKRFLSMRMVEN